MLIKKNACQQITDKNASYTKRKNDDTYYQFYNSDVEVENGENNQEKTI